MITMGWLPGIPLLFFCIFGSHFCQPSSVREITVMQGRWRHPQSLFAHVSQLCWQSTSALISEPFQRKDYYSPSVSANVYGTPAVDTAAASKAHWFSMTSFSFMANMLVPLAGRTVKRDHLYNVSLLIFSLILFCQQRIFIKPQIFSLQLREK